MRYRNSEGYSDPVAGEAIRRADRFWRPLVYICSPYSGDIEENTRNARRYCRFAVDHGAIPLAPHLLLPQFMSEETERELALFMGQVFLGLCEQVWVFGTGRSHGMKAEIARAERKQIPVRYFTEELKEVGKNGVWQREPGL